MRRHRLAVVFLLCSFGLQAQSPEAEALAPVAPDVRPEKARTWPLSLVDAHVALSDAATIHLPALTTADFTDVNRPPGVLKIGTVRPVNARMREHAERYELGPTLVQIAAVRSPDALRTRVKLAPTTLPFGAMLYIYSRLVPADVYGPYEGELPGGSDGFWSPPVLGDTVVLELSMPDGSVVNDPDLVIESVAHSYADPGSDPDLGNCHNDITSAWAFTANAVGGLDTIGGAAVLWCSGTMLNNLASDWTPYFLTANHCLSTNSAAQSLRIYWFYNSASAPLNTYSDVSTLLSTRDGVSGSDYTLLEINGVVPRNATWSGWVGSNPSFGTALTSIHHPDGSYQRISFGDAGTSVDCPSGITCANFIPVDWDNIGGGSTEPGSSGSGLWRDSDKKLVGQLYGGYAACGNFFNDYYGRFDLTYAQISSFMSAGSDDAFEENDTRAAARLTSAGSYANRIVKLSDEDWYRISVPAGQRVTLTTSFTDANGDIDLELFRGSESSPVDTSDSSSNSEQVAWTNTTASTADSYARVFLYDDTRNTYSLTITVAPAAPAAPSGLSASVAGSQINLSWTDNSNNETNFYVERSADGGSFGTIATLAANTTSHPDTSVACGISYSYRIRATNGAGSSYSNEASAMFSCPQLPTVSLSTTDANAHEAGSATGSIAFNRTGSTSQSLTVNYSIDGTATNGTDYNAISGSIQIAAGQSAASLIITPIDDASLESPEYVSVTIVAGSYTIGSPKTGSVTITDNDASITVSASDPNASETGPDPGTFTLLRNGSTMETLTVNYSLGGTAGNGSDYENLPGSVLILSGSASATIAVTPLPDALSEPTETVTLNVTSSSHYKVGSPASATVDIENAGESGTFLYLVAPCRMLDTRQTSDPLWSGDTRIVAATGVCGIPADARAIALNITVVKPSASGWLTIYPTDVARPSTSTISFRAERTRANNAIVRLSAFGEISVYNGSGIGDAVDFLIDVTGYFR